MNHPQGLYKAIKHYGSREEFARILGVSRQIVGYWLSGERQLPEWMALRIFVLLKGSIPLKELSVNHKAISDITEAMVFHTKNPTLQVPIKEIVYNDFQCPIYGSDEHFLINLSNDDLNRPVLITEECRLITCTCRLLANVLLGRRFIHAYKLNLMKVVNQCEEIEAIVESLPISERVALGLAIEREIGNRQGKRTDLQRPENNLEKISDQLVNIYAQVTSGQKTRAIAAKIAGFNSVFSYRQAKIVVAKGLPALIVAMDKHLCSISKAKQTTDLSIEAQQRFLSSLKELNFDNQHY
ncbi:MAG TPA: hypothetical protein VHE99_03080 [Gammaproteobacteria bacterium]|nr:hypothetical protein [Gammaproteobacteria bacterium]